MSIHVTISVQNPTLLCVCQNTRVYVNARPVTLCVGFAIYMLQSIIYMCYLVPTKLFIWCYFLCFYVYKIFNGNRRLKKKYSYIT